VSALAPDIRESSSTRLVIFFCVLGALCDGFDIQAAGVAALMGAGILAEQVLSGVLPIVLLGGICVWLLGWRGLGGTDQRV
jgi:hypothetical protein